MTPTRWKLTDFLHLFVLVSVALAQPLYDLLGRYPDFFVSHRAGPSIILGLVLGVSVLIPVLLCLVELVACLAGGETFRKVLHVGFTGILAGLVVMPPLNRWGILPDAVVYIAAAIFAGLFILLYVCLKLVRSFLTAMSPAILIFPAYFLFFTPVKSIVFQQKANPLYAEKIENKIPVTLIVFDEFNTMALLNKEGVIDSVRFPNFHSLAGESWWFPNAICSSLETTKSVPAILTGKKLSVNPPKPATASDHPENLFTLLAGQYYLNVHESETSLCPETLKKYGGVSEPGPFTSDIITLYRVLYIPGLIRNSSDYLDGRWKGFARSDSVNGRVNAYGILNRKKQIDGFIHGIRAYKKNQLNFLHLSLPHVPYEFLSSGRSYNNQAIFPDGLISEDAGWGNANEPVEVAYQRYLQQVGYTDQVLGSIMNVLKENGIYDNSLLIITADHGVSIQPQRSRRSYDKGNQQEILKVPTFLKFPFQQKTGICHDLVSGIDILPTIALVLGIPLPWETCGKSLEPWITGDTNTLRSGKVAVFGLGEFSLRDIEGFPLLAWKDSVFGSGTPMTRLVRRDRNHAFLGKSLQDLDIRSNELPFTAEVENIDQFNHIEPRSGYLPALIRGHITHASPQGKLPLTIALNGTIAATTSTTQWDDKMAFFTALFPEMSFQPGMNEVELFLIQENSTGSNPTLVRIPVANRERFILRTGKTGGESLTYEDGRELPLGTQTAAGFLDGFHPNEYTVSITGWAFDKKNRVPARFIVLFSGSRYIAQITPTLRRSDLSLFLKTEKAGTSGFRFEIPVHSLSGGRIRAFGITNGGVAFELKQTENVREAIEKFYK